jgi:phytoene dehydrogenase-like protein
MGKSAIIIGSGIAGLTTAIRLANKGYQVKVLEANSYPGGKLGKMSCKGYRFDTGPSLFTLPQLVDELFILSGRNPRSHFEYSRLAVNCHYFWEDGTRIKAYSDPGRFAREVHIKNLYFCGGSVHPGGGIPLCLLSAKIVSEMVG